ncbi:hypothetical protein [Streptomyces mirabilis]|uniref:hypothetical protein n=1 Tax=Streptomyces mirabilis TaxID=68239 RepID=UPI0036B2AA39
MSANSLCGVLEEVDEGVSYGGRAGARLGPVGGTVHGVGFFEDPADLADELDVPG